MKPANYRSARFERRSRLLIDGDMHDLRFLDGYEGAVIGLRAKGQAKRDQTGFVVPVASLLATAV